MENASKALIIAGAILLAISIIGIGMYVYQQAAGVMTGIGFDSEKIQAYNDPFERYQGLRNGQDVRALCEAVKNHNLANINDETKNIVVQKGSAAAIKKAPDKKVEASAINTIKSSIKSGKQYNVDFGYDSNTGYIVAVGIVEK